MKLFCVVISALLFIGSAKASEEERRVVRNEYWCNSAILTLNKMIKIPSVNPITNVDPITKQYILDDPRFVNCRYKLVPLD